ncbi:MAG: hypothetical protein HYR66_04370 [Sphingobacteriales bacterium]|nr:hypothetical protein [Sphingobacteriales bacterium]MBI3720236.1 hypothetical protein [Sphingobacteriales bacterium]
MLNNVVLDVVIGLVFIYLLYSLLATIVQEMIASRFALRARMLQKALRRMLEDDAGKGANEPNTYSAANYLREARDNTKWFFKPFSSADSLLYKFYSHPSIKYLGEGKLYKKPSYLHGHNFSQTLIHLLRGEDYDGRSQNESELIRQALEKNTLDINNETLKQLKLLFADSRQDSYLFKHKLEDWFEETMQRTTGWYKKQSQVILIIIGFVFAVAFNVDSIAIAKILMKDKKAREQLVQLAVSRQKEYGAIVDSVKKITVIRTETKTDSSTVTKIDSIIQSNPSDKYLDSAYNMLRGDAETVQGILGLRGIASKKDSGVCKELLAGFDSAIKKTTDSEKRNQLIDARKKASECCLTSVQSSSPYQTNSFIVFIGWLITAFAISLGAPFWFDLLNKLVKLRESGPQAKNTSVIDNAVVTDSGSNPVKDNNNLDIKG